MNLNNLEKRVSAIENKLKIDSPDPIFTLTLALEALPKGEPELIMRYRSLLCEGLSEDEIRDRLGPETYERTMGAIKRLDEEFRKRFHGKDAL